MNVPSAARLDELARAAFLSHDDLEAHGAWLQMVVDTFALDPGELTDPCSGDFIRRTPCRDAVPRSSRRATKRNCMVSTYRIARALAAMPPRGGRSGCSIPSLGGACAWVTRCLAQSHTNDVVRDDPGCGPPDRHGPLTRLAVPILECFVTGP